MKCLRLDIDYKFSMEPMSVYGTRQQCAVLKLAHCVWVHSKMQNEIEQKWE